MEGKWEIHKGRLIGKTGKLLNPTILNVFIIALLATVLLCRNCILNKREFNSTK